MVGSLPRWPESPWGPVTELPDVPKQQATMAHSLPKAVRLPARASKGWLPTPTPNPTQAHWAGLAACMTRVDAPACAPVTVAISRLCPTLATCSWNHAGPGALSHFCRAVPKATPVQPFPCPAANPFSESSLCDHQDSPPSLWLPRSASATTITALPLRTLPSTEIRSLPHEHHLPPASPHTNSCHSPQAGGSLNVKWAPCSQDRPSGHPTDGLTVPPTGPQWRQRPLAIHLVTCLSWTPLHARPMVGPGHRPPVDQGEDPTENI